MKMSLVRQLAALCLTCLLFHQTLLLAEEKSSPGALKNLDAGADVYEYVGDNLIARGHVVIRRGATRITADRAVVNVNSHDIEAAGNVTVTQYDKEEKLVDAEEYRELLNDFSKKIERLGVEHTPTGSERIRVRITNTRTYAKADRLTGNLKTGIFRFRDFALKSGKIYAAASYAERQANGKINVENARISTCDYIMDDHDHYAFTISKGTLNPRHYDSGLGNYKADHNKHTVYGYNALFRLWDIPVLWIPMIYKPQDSDTFGGDFAIGRSSDWGVWVRMTKGFTIWDDPYVNAGAMLDIYSDRGIGWGGKLDFMTANSRTQFFAYTIRDDKPYNYWDSDSHDSSKWYEYNTRLKIPYTRYDIKLTNITHITPRLDFRGQFELLSDFQFLDDFFKSRYMNENIQPPTYAALEYQFDRATAAIETDIRVNDFSSTMQRLPEFHLDFQRQELFKGLYYQGQNSAAYLDMSWRKYDKKSIYGDINDYQTGRFDTLHFLYYPIRFDYVNIIPRAGIRGTAYTSQLKNPMTDEQLFQVFEADDLDAGVTGTVPFRNFDVSNKALFRLAGELGVQVNTKIYRTWSNVRSSFLNLDGLRHVIVPYINYTYIPEPTSNSDEILYFDDIDRLKKQHFVRFGVENRMQTREGVYGSERIREWISVENYWDFHLTRTEGFNNCGDLGTRVKFTPFDDLTLTSELLIDIGGNNDHDYTQTRAGHDAGRVGLDYLKYINKWDTTLEYRISKDWKIKASYKYSDQYNQRSTYSMGTIIDTLNSSSSSLTARYPHSQWFDLDLSFPTYVDPKLKGAVFVQYDVDAALWTSIGFRLMRNFHCFNIGVEAGQQCSRDSDQDKSYSYYITAIIGLSAMPGNQFNLKSNM